MYEAGAIDSFYKELWFEDEFRSLCCERCWLCCYSDPAGKLVDELLCAKLSIEPDSEPSSVSSGYVSRLASASARALKTYEMMKLFSEFHEDGIPESHAGRFNVKCLELTFMLLAQQSHPFRPLLAELLELRFHLRKTY